MKSGKSQRRLANIGMTSKHHFRYLGLWILLVSALVVVLNIVLYLYAEERWGGIYSLDNVFHSFYASNREAFLTALSVETAMLVGAVILLAKVTVHRVAGVFIRLQNAFDTVRDGNMDVALKFRSYDRLDELQDSFNQMMAALRDRAER